MGDFNNMTEVRQDVFSTSVRAGKRTYFFDVKMTSKNDYYITITERKRRFNKNSGKFEIDKHRVFLYQEDFDKFIDCINEAMTYINNDKTE